EALVPQAPLYVDAVVERAGEDVDSAGVGVPVDVLVGHADGEVPYAAVEGADGEGGAEAVAGLGAVEGALAALPPRAALEGGVEGCGGGGGPCRRSRRRRRRRRGCPRPRRRCRRRGRRGRRR